MGSRGASFHDGFFTQAIGAGAGLLACYGVTYGAFYNDVAVMTLTALLSAQLPSSDGAGEGLAALLPLAGMTLLERQAQDAAAVGADKLLVLVDAVPAALTAAVDRIRARGLSVTIIRDGAAVIAATADGMQRMILVADGLVAPRALWETLVGASAPRLLAVGDTPATAALERIDVERRWAGLAVVDGAAVAALADLPPDWDPQLALLRAAIQADAPSIPCEPQLFERGDIALLERAISADLVEQRLLAKDADMVVGLAHANLAMPLVRAGARVLLRWQQSGLVARMLAVVGASGAGLAIVLGYAALAVIAAIGGLIGQAAAVTIAAFRPEGDGQRWLGLSADAVFAAAIMAAAWAAGSGDRGHMLIWLASGLATAQLLLLGRWLAARNVAAPRLIFDSGAFWLLLGAGVIAGNWPLVIAFAAPLAAASLLISLWQRRDRKAV